MRAPPLDGAERLCLSDLAVKITFAAARLSLAAAKA
jgi:hypothetical protein